MVNFDGGSLKRKFGETNLFTPPCSPASHPNGASGMVKMTPSLVRAGLDTAKWLQTVISRLPSKPSAELERFLSLGSSNIVNEVISRANIILGAIFPSIGSGERHATWSLLNVNLMDSMWSGQERIEAMKLYYKVLESICTSEAEKLSAGDLSGLLTNEKFHRCMLACAAELISAAHIRISILFPLVMERTGITAFDMSKVIESFIKHENSLPRELKRHLNSLEEKLLESMIWEKGSSLYNSLAVARPDLSDEIKRLKLLAEPMPSLDEIAMSNQVASRGLPYQQILHKHKSSVGQRGAKKISDEYGTKMVDLNSSASTMKDDPTASGSRQPKAPPSSPSLQTAFISPSQSKTPSKGGAQMNAAISLLFSKMTKLAAVRINCFAERLKLSQEIQEKIYLLFQRILTQKTYLFFNRRIDQIMLCCFYLVAAKVFNLGMTFQEINQNYIKQTQCRSQDLYGVFVSRASQSNRKNGESHVSIITFYNEIFVPNVKSLLEKIGYTGASKQVAELNNNNNDHCPNSPQSSLFQSLPDISPKKVSPSQNVYLSPLRSSKKDALNSNVGNSYYAFIGKSPYEYHSPSKELVAINNLLNSSTSRKRRRMLNFDDPSVTLISDSVVTMSLFPENDKCS